MSLEIQPITLRAARRFVLLHHRHHKPPQGGLFAIACNDGDGIVGVAIVGKPVARAFDDGWTAEVTRLCTVGTPHCASKLYAACWRTCRGMGYRRLVSYTLKTEPGTSLKAAGWTQLYSTRARDWTTPSRPRLVHTPAAQRTLWEVRA